MSDPEVQKGVANNFEVLNSTGERLEKVSSDQEKAGELSPRDTEALKERARKEALESSTSVESGGAEKTKAKEARPSQHRTISKKQENESFKKQMKDVQQQLPTTSRVFSKFVHNKFVEKTSEIVGSTIVRPNAVLAGAFFAFVLTLAIYVVSKNVGYKLSGFESIGAFVVGWTIGIIYDYLRIIITGKK